MEIKINGTPKEIVDLALELQNRQKEKTNVNSKVIQEQLELLVSASHDCSSSGTYPAYNSLAALSQSVAALCALTAL